MCISIKAQTGLPELPEMTFPRNSLVLEHSSGFKYEFKTIDALKQVDNEKNPDVLVAASSAWSSGYIESEKREIWP